MPEKLDDRVGLVVFDAGSQAKGCQAEPQEPRTDWRSAVTMKRNGLAKQEKTEVGRRAPLGAASPLSHYVSRQRQPIAFPITSPSAPHL